MLSWKSQAQVRDNPATAPAAFLSALNIPSHSKKKKNRKHFVFARSRQLWLIVFFLLFSSALFHILSSESIVHTQQFVMIHNTVLSWLARVFHCLDCVFLLFKTSGEFRRRWIIHQWRSICQRNRQLLLPLRCIRVYTARNCRAKLIEGKLSVPWKTTKPWLILRFISVLFQLFLFYIFNRF